MKIVFQTFDKTEEYSLQNQYGKVHVDNLYYYRVPGKVRLLDVIFLVQDAVAYFVEINSIPARNSLRFWRGGSRWSNRRLIWSKSCSIGFISGDNAGHNYAGNV